MEVQLLSVGQEWARELDFPNADSGFCLVGLEAAGKGSGQKWEVEVVRCDLGTGNNNRSHQQ